MADRPALRIEPLTVADWPSVRRIHAEGIATGDATLEREPPDWDHFDRSHRHDCRLVARAADGAVVGWTALSAFSARRVYAGVAWESVYVAADESRQRASAERSWSASSATPRRSACGPCWPGSWPRTRPAGPCTRASGSARSASRRRSARTPRGRWRDVVLLERRSATVGR